MIVIEDYMVRRDGVRLVRTYSDTNHYITRYGVMYEEAIDPEDQNREYEESDELIIREEDPAEPISEEVQ